MPKWGTLRIFIPLRVTRVVQRLPPPISGERLGLIRCNEESLEKGLELNPSQELKDLPLWWLACQRCLSLGLKCQDGALSARRSAGSAHHGTQG